MRVGVLACVAALLGAGTAVSAARQYDAMPVCILELSSVLTAQGYSSLVQVRIADDDVQAGEVYIWQRRTSGVHSGL